MEWYVTRREVGEDGKPENVLKTYAVNDETNEMRLVRIEDGNGKIVWEDSALLVVSNVLERLVLVILLIGLGIMACGIYRTFFIN